MRCCLEAPERGKEFIMVIKHGGARTRALYKWENEDLCQRTAGKHRMNEHELNLYTQWIWDEEGWDKCPTIHVVNSGQYSYSMGRKIAYLAIPVPNSPKAGLRIGGDNKVVLIHELVHCKGFGDYGPMHSVGFVKLYLRLLSKYLQWNHSVLVMVAKERGLI